LLIGALPLLLFWRRDVTDPAEGSPNSNGEAPRTQRRPALGRRGFVLAGAPLILTLANRPALATDKSGGGGFCTMSILASANLSNPVEAGANCGVSPGCWKNNAYGDAMWQSTGISPASTVGEIFNPPGNGEVGKWKWSDPNQTLIAALNASSPSKIGFRKTTSSTWYSTSNGTIKEIIAGFLNIKAFNSGNTLFGMTMWNHYPVSNGDFTTALGVLWGTVPNWNSAVDTAVSNFRNVIYDVPDGGHYCNVAF
jgi:hypothetical protein